ncbi:MAG: hypothetical protein V7L30_33010 [Nostoc sp.]|uniref:hypothetical protein n=1 Tax=Nostoc sp. TaxID=1180 RepID=UPI002FFAA159
MTKTQEKSTRLCFHTFPRHNFCSRAPKFFGSDRTHSTPSDRLHHASAASPVSFYPPIAVKHFK